MTNYILTAVLISFHHGSDAKKKGGFCTKKPFFKVTYRDKISYRSSVNLEPSNRAEKDRANYK